MPARYELTAEQWRKLEPFLPGKATDRGRTGTDNRLFVNGCLWVIRSGAMWHHLPERYGPWKRTYNRFRRWAHECNHWVLDVTYKEDDSRICRDNSAENLALLRRFALNLARLHLQKNSMKGKLKKAIWSDKSRSELLSGQI